MENVISGVKGRELGDGDPTRSIGAHGAVILDNEGFRSTSEPENEGSARTSLPGIISM